MGALSDSGLNLIADNRNIESELKSKLIRDLGYDPDSLFLSDSPEKKPSLFKAVEKDIPVYPCTCAFMAKPRSGRRSYMSYAAKRWSSKEEAFGIIPTTEIRSLCITTNRIKGIDCNSLIYSYRNFTSSTFSTAIKYFCADSYNVFFITDFQMISSHLFPDPSIPYPMTMSERQDNTARFLSNLSKELGIYFFVLMDVSKSKNLIDTFFGSAYIDKTTDSYVDLLFDWRAKRIKKRVFFGENANELIPETVYSLNERLEEEQLKIYGGYEGLWELLSHFKDGAVTVRVLMKLMKINSFKTISSLLQMAREDGYLQKGGRSHRLTEKGCEVIFENEKQGHAFYRFLEDTSSMSIGDSLEVTLKKTTFSKWKSWRNKHLNQHRFCADYIVEDRNE